MCLSMQRQGMWALTIIAEGLFLFIEGHGKCMWALTIITLLPISPRVLITALSAKSNFRHRIKRSSLLIRLLTEEES
ncbi:hypothetical protein L6164_011555 [Bauhinia variegata]|uniref:Uncharacterized protein n=1 Tax=Bauhinia variegata TaxID=167791 RepID=A0ACB9P8H3_BAUVA|nr:hypothetical protein L6164_011555 [Bauhinia variegata]